MRDGSRGGGNRHLLQGSWVISANETAGFVLLGSFRVWDGPPVTLNPSTLEHDARAYTCQVPWLARRRLLSLFLSQIAASACSTQRVRAACEGTRACTPSPPSADEDRDGAARQAVCQQLFDPDGKHALWVGSTSATEANGLCYGDVYGWQCGERAGLSSIKFRVLQPIGQQRVAAGCAQGEEAESVGARIACARPQPTAGFKNE